MKRATVMLVVGARPNFVKAAPLVAQLDSDEHVDTWLVHTGQHYDDRLSDSFFRDLSIRAPDDNLGVGSGSHGQQTAAVMVALERAIEKRRPDLIVTFGDVNSTMAAAIVAAKAEIPQAHVEAGLRSGDSTMPEEINRVVTDRLADLLFTHSDEADRNLAAEGVARDRIHQVGNTMIDTLVRLRPHWSGAAREALKDVPAEYGVVTLHRPSNVDDPERLACIVAALDGVSDEVPLFFPVHPRTRSALGSGANGSIRLLDPLGYLAFMDLLENARFAITDSGGIQEETTVLNVPCLTLRENTERPVTIRLGTNRLVGSDPSVIARLVREILGADGPDQPPPPLWDGRAAQRIAAVVNGWLRDPLRPRLSA